MTHFKQSAITFVLKWTVVIDCTIFNFIVTSREILLRIACLHCIPGAAVGKSVILPLACVWIAPYVVQIQDIARP